MTRIIDLPADEARTLLLDAKNYFRLDFPPYLSFQPVLDAVGAVLGENRYTSVMHSEVKPNSLPDVNYQFLTNKDGRFAWRPYEMIHPVIYVSLINALCTEENWSAFTSRFKEMQVGVVECCSQPVCPEETQTIDGAQILNWWRRYEQRSLELSLDYSHILQTDVTDCYGSLYTHSIPWALHGVETAKDQRNSRQLLGNIIDRHIQDSRFGQTNGIVQGSVLMDLIAELVLGFVDIQITEKLANTANVQILRYRDDYRVFANNDFDTETALKAIGECLRQVGMKLGAAKTSSSTNIVEAAIKPEKLAGMHLADMDITQAKSMQKQLLRLHAFARSHPNSGALNRLASEAFEKIRVLNEAPTDLSVQVAIVADIAFVSPQAFPALSGIIAKLISLAPAAERVALWNRVEKKMRLIPNSGYLEIWLQRITRAKGVELTYESGEAICKIADGECPELWNSTWINSPRLIDALNLKKVLLHAPEDLEAIPDIAETALFRTYAEFS